MAAQNATAKKTWMESIRRILEDQHGKGMMNKIIIFDGMNQSINCLVMVESLGIILFRS